MEIVLILARVAHIAGNIMWLGGGVAAALFMLGLASTDDAVKEAAARSARAMTLKVVTPGMLLGLAGGVTMLLYQWTAVYKSAPWMHTKLLVGLVAAGMTGMLTGPLRRAANGEGEVKPGAMKAVAAVLALSAVLGALLVTTRFGQG